MQKISNSLRRGHDSTKGSQLPVNPSLTWRLSGHTRNTSQWKSGEKNNWMQQKGAESVGCLPRWPIFLRAKSEVQTQWCFSAFASVVFYIGGGVYLVDIDFKYSSWLKSTGSTHRSVALHKATLTGLEPWYGKPPHSDHSTKKWFHRHFWWGKGPVTPRRRPTSPLPSVKVYGNRGGRMVGNSEFFNLFFSRTAR